MTSPDGVKLWEKVYNSSNAHNVCQRVVNSIDKNYIAVGYSWEEVTLKKNGLAIKFSNEGNIINEEIFGGFSDEIFFGVVAERDGGYTAVGSTKSYSYQILHSNVLIIRGAFGCAYGYYNSSSGCTPCPVGTYNPISGSSVCLSCSAGSYQPNEGQKDCILCPPGTYQNLASQTTCINCTEGYYQDNLGQTSCKTCEPNYLPNVKKSLCLYKGVFNNDEEFDSSILRQDCYGFSENIKKPYTIYCRRSIRFVCCNGSSILSSTGPICNNILEIASNSSLYNNYCNACLFMDQTQCPPQGVCWNDSLFVNNSYNQQQ